MMCISCVYVNMQRAGGGWGRGSGLDYEILLSQAVWVLNTADNGGG